MKPLKSWRRERATDSESWVSSGVVLPKVPGGGTWRSVMKPARMDVEDGIVIVVVVVRRWALAGQPAAGLVASGFKMVGYVVDLVNC
jgi:hypothetical protein